MKLFRRGLRDLRKSREDENLRAEVAQQAEQLEEQSYQIDFLNALNGIETPNEDDEVMEGGEINE